MIMVMMKKDYIKTKSKSFLTYFLPALMYAVAKLLHAAKFCHTNVTFTKRTCLHINRRGSDLYIDC